MFHSINRRLRGLLIIVAALCIASQAFAARLISTASGNIGTTGTWSVIDTTGTNAYLNSETANTALTTTPVASSTFTPAAETLTEIGVKLAVVAAAPTGTMTIKLANSTSPGSRECTQTVNVADLVSAAAATAEGGWAILTCAASPNGTDAYTITASTSSAAQVNLFSLATTNWSRLLVTSGTQAGGPAAGDFFFVFGQLTGAGTHNAFIVTINTTALTNYGNVAQTLVDPSVSVGQNGTLCIGASGTCGPAASTAYVFEFAGPEVTYNGGTVSFGTSGSPVPSTSSLTVTLNSTVEGDTGTNTRNGGTFNVAGASGGRSAVKTQLASTATAATTSTLTTTTSTGWLSGDSIYIAGTTTTIGTTASYKGETATLTSNATTTSVPLTGNVTNTHTALSLAYTSTPTGQAYSFNMFPDVVLLNRNVIIQGSGATTNGYLFFQASSNFAGTWVEFSRISGTTAGKRGIEADTGPNGSFTLTNFSVINSQDSSMVLAPSNTLFGGTASAYVLVQHGVFYNDATNTSGTVYGLGLLTGTFNPYWKIDDVAVIFCANGSFSGNAVNLASQNGQFSNISFSGDANSSTGALVTTQQYTPAKSGLGGNVGNTFGPLTFYTNVGFVWSGTTVFGMSGTISGVYIWHEQGRFNMQSGLGTVTIDPFYIVTSAFGIYNVGSGINLTVRNGLIAWDTSLPSAGYPLTIDATPVTVNFDNMDLCPNGTFGSVTLFQCSIDSGAATNRLISLEHDVSPGGSGYVPTSSRVFLRNSSFSNAIGAKWPTLYGEEGFYANSFVEQDCAACTPVTHGVWLSGGYISYDTTITHTSGYSERITPRVNTVSGYITGGSGLTTVGNTLTLTSGTPPTTLTDLLTSNGSGFVSGTAITGGSGTSYTVSQSVSVGSAGSPVQFQNYYSQTGSLLRVQSAPRDYGIKVAVKSGQTASVCVWLRPSINTDAAPPWGGSAVTYNGDNPRMIARQNPYMGSQSDTVMATSSPTAGTWGQFCGTTPTASADGEFEVVVDADQTFTSNAGGSINLTEWSCSSTCNAGGSSQFWWNGSPADFVAPVSSSSGGSSGMLFPGGLFHAPIGQ